MTMKWNFSGYRLFCIAILLFAAGNSAWAETVSREAQKHMNRGMAAVEMSKSPADYEEAIREFVQAARLAPRWQAPYFNLGYVQNKVGKYRDALNSYRKYLELVPSAPDAAQVQTEIDQIEYKLEKILEARRKEERIKKKYAAVLGVWEVTEKRPYGLVDFTREVRLRNGQLMVSTWSEYPNDSYTKQERERMHACKERWVPAEFDGTILTFYYGSSSVSSDFRTTHGYNDWRELNYTIKFPPHGTPEGHYVQRYTDHGYTGFCYGRVIKVPVTWERGSEATVNAWREIPE